MLYANDTPFDTNNRAWLRLLALGEEHFQPVTWAREDGRPVMLSLVDLASGDVCTLAVMESVESHDAHVLLAFTIDSAVTAYGPFRGEDAAGNYALPLVATDDRVGVTVPMRLQRPRESLAEDAWRTGPYEVLSGVNAPVVVDGCAAVVVIDAACTRLAIAGPFPGAGEAAAWRPDVPLHGDARLVVIPLTAPAASPLG